VTVQTAALLNEKPNPSIQRRPIKTTILDIERAHGEGREVSVELIVNGYPVAKQTIVAAWKSGIWRFDAKIDRAVGCCAHPAIVAHKSNFCSSQ
jgi:hypothetical protein